MRLENLYTNFGRSFPEEQLKFVAEYRLRRAKDLETILPMKKTSVTKSSKVELSVEEREAMKLLGLKPKDILALRASIDVNEEDQKTEDLFKDDSFNEEEE